MAKTILFQGDSITDGRRKRELFSSVGAGYAGMVTGQLGCEKPGEYEFINRGISGNRSIDIYARIKSDIIDLKPDYMSILCGTNDVWYDVGGKHDGLTAQKYEMILDLIISEVKEALPNIKMMVLGSFVVEGTATRATEEEPDRWEILSTEIPLRAAAAERVAKKHGLPFIPLQKMFDDACKVMPASYWVRDGFHPTAKGHWLIKEEWLKAFKNL